MKVALVIEEGKAQRIPDLDHRWDLAHALSELSQALERVRVGSVADVRERQQVAKANLTEGALVLRGSRHFRRFFGERGSKRHVEAEPVSAPKPGQQEANKAAEHEPTPAH